MSWYCLTRVRVCSLLLISTKEHHVVLILLVTGLTLSATVCPLFDTHMWSWFRAFHLHSNSKIRTFTNTFAFAVLEILRLTVEDLIKFQSKLSYFHRLVAAWCCFSQYSSSAVSVIGVSAAWLMLLRIRRGDTAEFAVYTAVLCLQLQSVWHNTSSGCVKLTSSLFSSMKSALCFVSCAFQLVCI